MAEAAFVDTSALIKWFIREEGSAEFQDFIDRQDRIVIARLAMVELRSALARRRRTREITSRVETQAYGLFMSEIAAGAITVIPASDAQILAAGNLIRDLPGVPLRTLDAVHLAVAHELGTSLIATADKVMSAAAHKLGLEVAYFGR